MDDFIEVKELQKNYTVYERTGLKRKKRIVRALRDIDFTVKRGEFLGYIGPNGAGKSTTIKILTGIMVPDHGTVRVDKWCPWKNRKEYVRNIGVVFGQKTQMWWDLPVKDTYTLLKALYKVPDDKYKKHIKYLIERLHLSEILNQPVRQLSLGQRMRAELAAAMIHDPDILFLDEPTIGLDVVSKHRVQDFLMELNRQGKTIFLTTHDLKDIETLCNEILIINHGTLIYKGKVSGLKALTDIPTVIRATLKESYKKVLAESLEFLSEIGGTYHQERDEIVVKLHNKERPGEIAKRLFQKFEIEDFRVEEPDIEEIIKAIYRQN
ncbi:MAG: viologen exporter family transport system ATP-binding protein [Kosmotoga sp.]|nr:viologen exporter family transport system ATP-binding protein [Kosmotoga sp.]